MSRPRLFDPGLQPERTALAWRRTTLAVVVGSLAGARVLAGHGGWAGLLLGAVGAGWAVLLWSASVRRTRTTTSLLLRRADLRGGPAGGLPLALSATCSLGGLVALVAVLATWV